MNGVRLACSISFCVYDDLSYLLHFSKQCLTGKIQRKFETIVRKLLFVKNDLKGWHQGLLGAKPP